MKPVEDAGPEPPIPRTRAQWAALLRELPGYDPFAEAGDCWFDSQTARRKIRFFHTELRHFKGERAGCPFYLERWQMAVVANLFGWKRPDGTRRYRWAFLLVGRKNGKSPFAAGLVLLLLFDDEEPGAEIYSAGLDYRQAAKVWEYVYGMVVQNPKLLARCEKLYNGQAKLMQLPASSGFSFYRPVPGKPGEGHSLNASGIVIDELHLQERRDLVESLETSTANRRQPLGIYLTTADFDRESICNEKHDYARSVRDEGGDPYWLPVLYEAEERDASPERLVRRDVWRRANPNLGVSIQESHLEEHARRAVRDPAYRATFARVHLCVRTAASGQPLVPADAWKTCGKRDFSPEDLVGRRCWGGLDLAATTHSNAFVLVFPEGRGFYALCWFWLPATTVEEWEFKGRARYRVWADRGRLTVVPGNLVDYGWIRRDIREISRQYRIVEIAADRLFQGAQICTDLQNDGFRVIAFGQGFVSMAAPTKMFRELVLGGRFWHGNNPVLNWHAANCSAASDPAGNLKPNRERLHAPIDGVVSAIMALGRAATEPADQGEPRVRAI